MAALLSPFEALTLLITAIGHDVGHPGVNNGFLVTLNAPLAQLYNDRSVLESFHCAAYSQILRRYWPAAFADSKMRNLMISSILATDMGLHFDYMRKLGELQAKLRASDSTEGWTDATANENKALACALLIKCADISNVVSTYIPVPSVVSSKSDSHSCNRPGGTTQLSNGCTSSLMSSLGKPLWKASCRSRHRSCQNRRRTSYHWPRLS